MSPMLISLLLLLALVVSASSQNSTVKESLKLHLNSSGETSKDDRIKTTTENTEQTQDVHHESTTNEVPHKWPGLVFNPPDFFRFPKNSKMARFWQDNSDFKAIPDLPAEDTEYPYWLQVVMGRVRPTTPSLTADNDQVRSSKDDQSERNGESFNSRISPKINPIEKEETFESNNLPTETGNEPFFPTENLLKESDEHISEHQSIPNRSNKQHNGPILFRLPLIDSMQNIPERKYLNDPRNINFGNSRTNRFEERPPPDLLVEMLPPDPRFQRIPISINRPSVLERPGNFMLPIRNRNFRQTNFIHSDLPRPFPIKEQIMESPKPNNPVDPQLSRQPWLELQQEDNDRLQEVPAQSVTRHTSVDPKKQFQMISIHKNISLPKQSEINFRAKRQAAFESFDPFAFGNMFSFLPQRKEEPDNSFNWFPQEPMMRTPVRQPPPVNNPQSFIPVRNQRPTNPPMQQPNLPQDAWVISPASSSAGNQGPNPKSQMPPKNHRSNNGQIPDDFLLIQPRNGGNLNDMPWTISNLFGTNPFQNRGGQIWNFQKPFDPNLGIYPRQPTNINQGGFLNNSPWNPFDSERISQPNRENNFVFPPFWQNPPPRQGQEQVQPPREDNSHQAQWNHPSPSQNRNNFVQPPVSQNPPPRQGQEHIQPPRQDNSHPGQWNHPSLSQNRNDIKPKDKQVDVKPAGRHPQFQGDWKPAPEIHAQPKLPPGLHGTWIPKGDSQKKMPNIETEHFQEAPLPQDPKQPNEHHHQAKNPLSKPVEVPQITEERHRKPMQPEVMKGKRKLSPSEVRHLLSLLPELPKKVYIQPNEKKQNPETSSSSITTDSRRKRLSPRPVLETDAGNLTRNYPGPIHLNRRDTLSANRHLKSLEFLHEKRRKKRDLEDSLVQDVVFGSYGYQSEHGYEDTESFSYFSRPFFSFPSSNFHNTDEMNGFWSNSYPRGPPGFYHGLGSWPYGFYGHHSDFRHFLPNHGAGLHHNPHHHPHHHPDQKHDPHDHGHWFPQNQSPFPGGRHVLVIPPAVPRANANQLSYTARFRYRFGIYPGYSDYIPSTDNHEIFFFYDDQDEARRRDAVIPFRSY